MDADEPAILAWKNQLDTLGGVVRSADILSRKFPGACVDVHASIKSRVRDYFGSDNLN